MPRWDICRRNEKLALLHKGLYLRRRGPALEDTKRLFLHRVRSDIFWPSWALASTLESYLFLQQKIYTVGSPHPNSTLAIKRLPRWSCGPFLLSA
ncbi:hypothetical protein PanWU01x14_249030 [Parasponia andersonii]|uniref:Uncharacterized protein n=1 Tax=Parasponia andersonii TaxID=3476 RepID=A0A2P5BDE8_PARAD|nr:hypothetical protein PanWU01x14_249030 [Parasponia andersonii]